ncbi:hypothetical protein Q3G72_016838 [Acer saccharum]|nr:hypothetical protein Q3G72_016838 [Acer saccharum]
MNQKVSRVFLLEQPKQFSMMNNDHDYHNVNASQQQQQFEQSAKSRWQMSNTSPAAIQSQQQPQHHTYESFRNVENHPSFRRGLDKVTYSLNQIGDTFEKAFEEGMTLVENKKCKYYPRNPQTPNP